MKLYIKNMVCPRCKTAVETIMEKAGVDYPQVGILPLSTNSFGGRLPLKKNDDCGTTRIK